MRAVVQRVTSARVHSGGRLAGEIGAGLMVLLGVAGDDGPADVRYMTGKIRDLRIFDDEQGKMNRSVVDTGGSVMIVSQFTLYADCRKGRRPSFDQAATPETARVLYEDVVRLLRADGLRVETGEFQARMTVDLINDGPVTLLLDSRRGF